MPGSSIPIPGKWVLRFFTIWGGQAFSLLGSALVQFALVWYLTLQTDSATVLATATLVALLPQIALGPFVGALIDRWNRRPGRHLPALDPRSPTAAPGRPGR